jgi:hypothetical protein
MNSAEPRRSRARGALALLRVLRHHQATHLDAAQRAAAEELLQALLGGWSSEGHWNSGFTH